METIGTIRAIKMAKKAGVDTTRPTIVNWCIRYKIGKKIAGRWVIDPEKLKTLLKGDA